MEGHYSENISAYLVTLTVPAGQTVTVNGNIYASEAGAYSLNTSFAGSEPVKHTLTVTGETIVPVVRPRAEELPAKVTVGQKFDFTLFFQNETCANAGMGTVYMDFLGTNTGSALKVTGKNSNRELTREEDAAGLRAYSTTFNLTPFMPMIIPVWAVATEPGTYQFKLTCGNVESEVYTLVVEEAPAPQNQPFTIGTQGYATIQEAIDAAKTGDTILMNQDVTAAKVNFENWGEAPRTLILDLGGHVLTWDVQTDVIDFVDINGGDVTLANGTLAASDANGRNSVVCVTNADLTLKNIRIDQSGAATNGVDVYGQSNLSVDANSVISGNSAVRLYTRDDQPMTAEIAGTVRSINWGEAVFSFTQSGSTGCQIHFAPTAVLDGPVRTHSNDQVRVDNGSRFRESPTLLLNDQQAARQGADGFYVVMDKKGVTFTNNLEITTTLPQACATGKMCEFDVTFRNLGDTVYDDKIVMDMAFSAGDLFDIYFEHDLHIQWESGRNGYVFFPHFAPGSVTVMHCRTSAAKPGTLTINFSSGTEEPQSHQMAFEGKPFTPSYVLTAEAPTQVSAGMTFRIYATLQNPSAVVASGELGLYMLNPSADKPFEMNSGKGHLNAHHNTEGIYDGGSVWYHLDPFESEVFCYVVKIPTTGDYQFQLSTGDQEEEPFTVAVVDSVPADPSICDARIGNVGFRTLQEALDNAQAGDTITAMKDIVSNPISCLGVDLRLDLMGHKLTIRDITNQHACGINIWDSRLDIYNGYILGESAFSMDVIHLENSSMDLRNTRVECFGKETQENFYPSSAINISNNSRLQVDADSVLYSDTGIICNSTYEGPCEVIYGGQIRHRRNINSVNCWNSALNITFTETAIVDGFLALDPPANPVFLGGKYLGDPSPYLHDDQYAVKGTDGYYTINTMTPPSENDPILVQESIPAAGVTGEAIPVSFTVINKTDIAYEDLLTFSFRSGTNHHLGDNVTLVMDGDVTVHPIYSPSGNSAYEAMISVPAQGQVTLNGTLYVARPGTYKFISSFQDAHTLPAQMEVTGEAIRPVVQVTATNPQASVPAGTIGHMAMVVNNSTAARAQVNMDIFVTGPNEGKGLRLRYNELYPNKRTEPGIPEFLTLYINAFPFTTNTYDIEFLATEPGTYTVTYHRQDTGEEIVQTVVVTPYVAPDPSQCKVKVGNRYFRTLDEGIAALNSGDTLTLLKDITADGILNFNFENSYAWDSVEPNLAVTVDLGGHTLRIRPHAESGCGIESSNMDLTLQNGTVRWASAPLQEENLLIGFSQGHLTIKNAVIGDQEFSAESVGIDAGDGSVVNIDASSVVWGNPAVSMYSFSEKESVYDRPVELNINGRLECGAPDNQAYVLHFSNHSADSYLTIGSSAVLKGRTSIHNNLRNFNVANGARFTVSPINLLHVGQNFERDASGLWKVVLKKNETIVQPLPPEIPQEDQAAVKQVAQNVQTVISPQEPTPADVAAAEQQGATDVKVDTYLDVAVKEYQNTTEAKTLVMDIEPMAQVKATKGNEEINIGEPKPVAEQRPVEVIIPLPDGFAAQGEIIYLIHTKDDGTAYKYELPVQMNGNGELFIQFYNVNGFSTFAVTKIKPEPKLTITQTVAGNNSVTFQVANTGTADYTGELVIYVTSDAAGGELTLTFPENTGAVKTSYGYRVPIAVPAKTGVVTLEAAAAANMSGVYRVASSANGTGTLESVLEISNQNLIRLMGANVVAGNNLNMMFAIPGSARSWEGCYAKIVRTYSDGRDDDVVTYSFAEWVNHGGQYYTITYKGLAAKEMTDTLTVTVYSAQGEALTEPWKDSMRSYAMRSLEKENISALQKTVMVDMLNYGAAAQEYFQYGTDNLANSLLTAEQKSFASEQKPIENIFNQGNAFVASNLVLKSNLQFLLAFRDLTEDMHAVVKFQNHYGKPVEKTIPGSQFGTVDQYRTINIDNLVIADARQEITVTIYRADGSIYTECHESIEGYLARQVTLSEVYQMVIRFADSAYEHLNSIVQ